MGVARGAGRSLRRVAAVPASDATLRSRGPATPVAPRRRPSAAVREQARQEHPTDPQGTAKPHGADERDAAVALDDRDIDEAHESHTELLARQLGAEIIVEEVHPS